MSHLQNGVQVTTRDNFIQHGLAVITTPAAGICPICTDTLGNNEEVVKVIPCKNCFFHKTCIVTWFESSHEQRCTCPNDRRILFQLEDDSRSLAILNDEPETSDLEEVTFGEDPLAAYRAIMRLFSHNRHAAIDNLAIIDAWQSAGDDIGYLMEMLESIHWVPGTLPADRQIQMQQEVDDLLADFNHLACRYTDAVRQVAHERYNAIVLDIAQKRSAGVYIPNFLVRQCRDLVHNADRLSWRFVGKVLEDISIFEDVVRRYTVISSG